MVEYLLRLADLLVNLEVVKFVDVTYSVRYLVVDIVKRALDILTEGVNLQAHLILLALFEQGESRVLVHDLFLQFIDIFVLLRQLIRLLQQLLVLVLNLSGKTRFFLHQLIVLLCESSYFLRKLISAQAIGGFRDPHVRKPGICRVLG